MIENSSIRKKLIIVGDGACGKTSILHVFTCEFFPETYTPTVFANYPISMEVDGNMVELVLWDTAGQEDYDRLRTLSYSQTNVCLITFSIDSPDSLSNVILKWYPEVAHYCPNVPIILVGNKMDLRNDPDTISELAKMKQEPVTTEDGMNIAKRIDAAQYLECSAKTQEGIREVFDVATRVALAMKKKKKSKRKLPSCCIL
ncbi:hypothetical protein RDWZM_010408 [Blomia tropicalis]|uniref:Uncharacterized protein n=1 Tax=Blomia tropicalis TaxID=40697 RepID=A0A9Q0LZE3_BLOTA|nr:hypothetical protein RDWZM_010408 [Blomia tropicalis]